MLPWNAAVNGKRRFCGSSCYRAASGQTAKTQIDPTYVKPPIKWAGGKHWLLDCLAPLWEKHSDRRLVEPFCGALAVALGLRPAKALLNDINPHLVNFHRWLQRGLTIDITMEYDKDAYYRARDRFNELIRYPQSDGGKESASLFYYLNRSCFNGLCRFNSSSEFNVPFGRYDKDKVKYRRDFSAYQAAYSGWTFTVRDFQEVTFNAGDFVNVDPPYDGNETAFTSYSAQDFNWGDQVRLVKWLDRHDGPVVASNLATERILALYSDHGFTIETIEAPRRINNTGDRTPAREMLATRGI